MATDRPLALPTYVALHDIGDVEGFVCATIERSGLRKKITPSEHLDLIDEGICILYELAEKFEPQREGYDQPGRFSGYAAQFLPRRLGDAWHKSHPEHVRVAGEDGKRRWRYHEAPISFENYVSGSTGHDNGKVDSNVGRGAEIEIRPREHWAAVAPS